MPNRSDMVLCRYLSEISLKPGFYACVIVNTILIYASHTLLVLWFYYFS